MKINEEFILRQIADEYLLIPVGETAQTVKGMIALSESGYLLYQKLRECCSREGLVKAILAEYEVEEATAAEDVDAFLNQMRDLNILIGE